MSDLRSLRETLLAGTATDETIEGALSRLPYHSEVSKKKPQLEDFFATSDYALSQEGLNEATHALFSYLSFKRPGNRTTEEEQEAQAELAGMVDHVKGFGKQYAKSARRAKHLESEIGRGEGIQAKIQARLQALGEQRRYGAEGKEAAIDQFKQAKEAFEKYQSQLQAYTSQLESAQADYDHISKKTHDAYIRMDDLNTKVQHAGAFTKSIWRLPYERARKQHNTLGLAEVRKDKELKDLKKEIEAFKKKEPEYEQAYKQAKELLRRFKESGVEGSIQRDEAKIMNEDYPGNQDILSEARWENETLQQKLNERRAYLTQHDELIMPTMKIVLEDIAQKNRLRKSEQQHVIEVDDKKIVEAYGQAQSTMVSGQATVVNGLGKVVDKMTEAAEALRSGVSQQPRVTVNTPPAQVTVVPGGNGNGNGNGEGQAQPPKERTLDEWLVLIDENIKDDDERLTMRMSMKSGGNGRKNVIKQLAEMSIA